MRSTLAILVTINLLALSVFAGHDNGGFQPAQNQFQNQSGGDQALVAANSSGRRVSFIQAEGLVVVQLLPDDTQGLPHQKFVVQLSDGSRVTIVSNLDMCPHIPVQVRDVIGAAGEYIPTGHRGGLLHWTHKDTSHQRPDGYIEFKGQKLCQ